MDNVILKNKFIVKKITSSNALQISTKMTTSTEDQQKNHLKFKTPTDTGPFYSSIHQKWLSYPFLGGKNVKIV